MKAQIFFFSSFIFWGEEGGGGKIDNKLKDFVILRAKSNQEI